ncbi:uncharacterized protein PG998_004993 [Apiospora kogelbergensis]|uniref:uncharacterized protein n=1 Tax=Apiospora kogelbergensis TaxID=1337665 RepID=UPI00312F3B0D
MQISNFCLVWLIILALHPALRAFVRALLAVTSWVMCVYMLYWGLKLGLLLVAGTPSLNSSFPFERIMAITDENEVYYFNSETPIAVILIGWLLWYLVLVCSFCRGNTAGMMLAVFVLFLATLCYPGIEALASAGSRQLWGLDLPTLPPYLRRHIHLKCHSRRRGWRDTRGRRHGHGRRRRRRTQ